MWGLDSSGLRGLRSSRAAAGTRARRLRLCVHLSRAQVSLMTQRGAASKAMALPTPEDVRKREGVILCRHTRQPSPCVASRASESLFECLWGELLLLRRLLSTGSDVVLCSFPPSPRAASSIAILLSTPDCIVSEHQGCVHVAAVRDCAADALVYAAFVAYCHAASGMCPPLRASLFSPLACIVNLLSPLRLGVRRLSRANDGCRVEPCHAPAASGQPRAAEPAGA